MCKKVGLIIWKLPMLKAYAPVMRELLAREVEIFLLVIPLPSGIVSRDLEGQALTDFNEEFFQDNRTLRRYQCASTEGGFSQSASLHRLRTLITHQLS